MNNRPPQYTNQQPMRGMANQMATHGRYGDSMLVHMNPVEVQGLASLSPTGELTTNPMTGQPEAFLPFLAPLLGSMFGGTITAGLASGAAGLGLGTAAAGTVAGTGLAGLLGGAATNAALSSAIGSGLATTAVTGDIKEGIMSGLTGFGIGKALGAVGDITKGVGAATDASTAATTALETTTQAANAASMVPGSAPLEELMKGSAVTGAKANALAAQDALAAAKDASAEMTNFQRIQRGYGTEGAAGAFGSQLASAGSLIPIAVGEGARGQRKMNQANERALADYEKEKADTLARSTAVRDSAIQQARDDYAYQDYGYAGGGLVSVNPQEYMRQMNGVHTVGMKVGGPAEYNHAGMPGKGGYTSPASAGLKQRSVRPANVVTADQLAKEAAELSAQGKDPRAGFTGEINYFRKTPEEAGIPVPDGDDNVNEAPSGGNVDPSNPIDTGGGPISIGGKGGAMNLSQEEIKNIMDKMGPVGAGGAGSSEKPFIDPSATASVGGGGGGNPPKPPLDVIKAKEAIDAIGAPEPIVPIYTPPKPLTDPSLYSDPFLGGGPMGGNPKTMPPMGGPMPNPMPPMGGPMPPMGGPMPMPKPPMPNPMPPMGGPMPPVPAPMPPMPAPPMPNPMLKPTRRTQTRRVAGGGVVNLQGGGIADIPQQEMAPNFNNPSLSNDPLIQQATAEAMQGGYGPVLNMNESGQMGQGEAMEVARQVAQALSQGITIEQLPPELAQKLMLAIELFGMEAVQSMIMQPQGQAPQSYSFQEGGVTPNASPETQLIEQTISAVLGQLPQDQADIIINQFISEFGQEAFEMLRKQALQSVVPNAQTEGVIKGQGGGMDDRVNGMIGAEQPVAVSPGEYIVPADVVSGLGDGSTDGGVQELDGMLDRVRQTRTGTTVQPAPMRTGGALPA